MLELLFSAHFFLSFSHRCYLLFRKGVTKNRNKFKARVYIHGRYHHVGTFDTPKEAALAYDRAALQAQRPQDTLNFPATKTMETYTFKNFPELYTKEDLENIAKGKNYTFEELLQQNPSIKLSNHLQGAPTPSTKLKQTMKKTMKKMMKKTSSLTAAQKNWRRTNLLNFPEGKQVSVYWDRMTDTASFKTGTPSLHDKRIPGIIHQRVRTGIVVKWLSDGTTTLILDAFVDAVIRTRITKPPEKKKKQRRLVDCGEREVVDGARE